MEKNIPSLRIRPATAADIPVLREFEQGVIAAERPFDPTLPDEEVQYYDLEELINSPEALLVVAEADGEVIASGYAKIRAAKPWLKHPQEAYLGFMYVQPHWRGKGVNRQILQELGDWAVSQGVREIRLEVYDENAAAISAYQKAGFTRHIVEMRLGL